MYPREPAGGQTPVRLRADQTPPGPRGTFAHLHRLTPVRWLLHREQQAEPLLPPRHAPAAAVCLLSFPEGEEKNPSLVRCASVRFYQLLPGGVPGSGRLALVTRRLSAFYWALPPHQLKKLIRDCWLVSWPLVTAGLWSMQGSGFLQVPELDEPCPPCVRAGSAAGRVLCEKERMHVQKGVGVVGTSKKTQCLARQLRSELGSQTLSIRSNLSGCKGGCDLNLLSN